METPRRPSPFSFLVSGGDNYSIALGAVARWPDNCKHHPRGGPKFFFKVRIIGFGGIVPAAPGFLLGIEVFQDCRKKLIEDRCIVRQIARRVAEWGYLPKLGPGCGKPRGLKAVRRDGGIIPVRLVKPASALGQTHLG